jgi:hypothetical protein
MWVLRELFRLLWTIAVAAAITAVVAAAVALARGGGFAQTLRIMFFLFGALLLLMATGGGGRQTVQGRRMTYGVSGLLSGTGFTQRLPPVMRARPGEPALRDNAVFVGSGVVLIALGAVL